MLSTAAGCQVFHALEGSPLTTHCGLSLDDLKWGINARPGQRCNWSLVFLNGYQERQLLCDGCAPAAQLHIDTTRGAA